MAVGGLSLSPMHVSAADTDEIMLGVFWTSDEDTTDTIYFSTNGVDFHEICEAYTDATPNDANSSVITKVRHNYKYAIAEALGNPPGGTNGYDVDPQVLQIDSDGNYVTDSVAETTDVTLHDPSIIYRDGYFWMISGFATGTGENRRVVPMLGYSKDLINWSFPSSGSKTNIKLSEVPAVNNDRAQFYKADEWDMVAPDFFEDDNGDIYIVFSVGYFALFHNEDTRDNKTVNDEMYPYIAKISGITMPTYKHAQLTGKDAEEKDVYTVSDAYVPDPAKFPESADKLQVTYSDATPIKLPCMSERESVGHNHIDASLYKEGEYYYYTIKENGVTNEIWRTKDISKASDPASWEEVSHDAVTGYEGPCLTKYQGEYFLYMDRLSTFCPTDLNGVQSDAAFGSEGTWVAKATIGTTGALDQYTGWLEDNIKEIKTMKKDGSLKANRHGTVITVTGEAAAKVRAAAKAAGYKDEDLVNSYKASDWKSTGWYQKETYLDKSIYGTDVNFHKYYYEDGKRIGSSKTSIIGTEKVFEGDPNPYFFKADASDPDLDGKFFCSSADDGYNKGEVQACLPVDWDYFNEVGPDKYGTAASSWRWMRYDWKGLITKSTDNLEAHIPGRYQDGATKDWFRYDPETGYMHKGAFGYDNPNGDHVFLWFDLETGKQLIGDADINWDNPSTEGLAKLTVNRRNFYIDKWGTVWYEKYVMDQYGQVWGPALTLVSEDGVLPVNEYYSPKDAAFHEEGHPDEGWYKPEGEDGAWFWYEGGVRQGITSDAKGVYGKDDASGKAINRGREICDQNTIDPSTQAGAWFWLDSDANGKRAVGKEVWVPYIYQDEGTWTKDEMENVAQAADECMREYVYKCMLNATGKWVRYDNNGLMLKGWITIEGDLVNAYPDQEGNTYYYDTKTGLMAKGWIVMGEDTYYFDEITGVMTKGSREIDGTTYNFGDDGKCTNAPKK